LAEAWAERRYQPEWLVDSAGRRLKVIFPGRRWGGPGPDFRGALLVLADGSLLRGDVEIHRRARDWIEHRHAADTAYANVVLHVVQRLDVPTLNHAGGLVPTVELSPIPAPEPSDPRAPTPSDRHKHASSHPRAPGPAEPYAHAPSDHDAHQPAQAHHEAPTTSDSHAHLPLILPSSNGHLSRSAPVLPEPRAAGSPGRGHTTRSLEPLEPPWLAEVPCLRDGPAVLAVVVEAGRERFRAKASRFEGDLAVAPPDQVLWRGIAEALGYSRNVRPFGLLADAVPWLEAATVVEERGPVGLAGLLLGAAGLRRATTIPEAHAWVALQRTRGWRPALGSGAWDHRARRAANAPAQRCRGLAELAARWASWRTSGPAARRWSSSVLAEQALEAVEGASRARRPRLWPFACASPWIGRGRAQAIAINVLVPFAAAAGVAEAAALFERLPGEPSNRVVRYMAEQLGAPAVRFRGACQQQGLLHLFKLTCAARICERCPARRAGAWAALDLDF